MKAFNITQEAPLLPEQEDQLIKPRQQQALSWCQRTFGKLHAAGVRSSIFLLVATALGPGCLTLPMAFKNSGLVFGTLFLIMAALFSGIALYMLFQASKKTFANSYAECVALILGYKSAVAIQLIIVVYVFFVLVAYEMMSKIFYNVIIVFFKVVQIINGMFMHFGVEGGLADRHSWQSKIMAVLICTSIFPLCLKRDLSKLNYVATLGVASILYVVMVIVIQCPSYIDRYWDKGHIIYAKFDWNLPASFTYAVFAFTCYTVVFQVRAEMNDPTKPRMTKVLTRAVLMEFFIYGSLAIFAYISLLDKIPGVILNRPALGGKNAADIPMQIARLMMALVIYLGIPINISPCKQGIIILALGTLKSVSQKTTQQADILFKITPKVNFWVSFGIMYLGVFFVIVYPEILFVVKLISGYLACSMGLLFPTLLYVTNLKEQNNNKTNFQYWAIMIGGIFFSCIGYFAATLNVYQMLGGQLPGVETQGN